MYNIEQITLLIEEYEKKLQDQNQNGAPANEIQETEEILKSLKIYKARYEIARILGQENNESYSKINYIGIEKEDLSNYNLTPEQTNDIATLINEIPADDVDLYRARLEIAKLLKMDQDNHQQLVNFEGIENNDPNNMQFNLTATEIAQFNNLKTTVDNLKQNVDNKNHEFNSLTVNVINDLYIKLNNLDLNDYQNRKDEYLETFTKLTDIIYSSKEFHLINHYELAYDLYKKFPDAKVELTNDGIRELIDLLNTTQIQDADKYNDYLDLVAQNINRLSEDENNRNDIDDLLNRINQTNYSLRLDLNSKINLDNLAFKDNEIQTIFNYLDSNYDNIEESKREKIYSGLKEKITKELASATGVTAINGLLLNMANKNFKERLRNDFNNNHRATFNDRHVTAYSGLIEEKIKKLEEKKKQYPNKNSVSSLIRIKEIDKEIEALRNQKLEYNNGLINGLDSYYNSKSEKIIAIEKEINDLNQLKNNLRTEAQKRKIDKRIQKLNDKIKKLKDSQIKIEGAQKRLMAPKSWINLKRGMIKRHFESKSEAFHDLAEDYQRMADTTRNLNGMFNGIKTFFYEFKAGRYNYKSELNRSIFNLLNNSTVRANGNNTRVMNRNNVNNLRNRNRQVAQQTI